MDKHMLPHPLAAASRQPRQRRRLQGLAVLLRNKDTQLWTCSLLVMVATALFLACQWLAGGIWFPLGTTTAAAGTGWTSPLPPEELAFGRAQCALNEQHPTVDYTLAARRLAQLTQRPRTGKRVVLRNATLVDGDGTTTPGCTVAMQDGIFVRVVCGPDETAKVTVMEAEAEAETEAETVIDLHGRIVTPGLVDPHSHVGVRETPQLWATEDVTEVSSPVTPWARAVDGLKPQDQAIRVIASGGVTTALVLTGAKNMISGEGAAIKMRADTLALPELLLNMTDGTGTPDKPQRHLKMAMGENQKRQFQGTASGPATRLGESFWFRTAYAEAATILRAQDRWCAHPDHATDPYPSSLQWQTLVDVLRGDVRVHVHGYEPEDIWAMLDHADEAGFRIAAWHHALHADSSTRLLDELARRHIAVVGFADSWGDKRELYHVSSQLPKHVAEHGGVPFLLTRDHPAVHGQFLVYEAQIAHHFGLAAAQAVAAVIGEPARLLGLDNRLGFVRPGYDADLVVWDRHPLRVGAVPLAVFIDGRSTVRASDARWQQSLEPAYAGSAPPSRIDRPGPAPRPASRPASRPAARPGCQKGQSDLVLHGIRTSFVGSDGLRADAAIEGRNVTVVVRRGRVVCVGGGDGCEAEAEALLADTTASASVVHLHEGYVLPGLTVVNKQHGLIEMVQEPSTTDGAGSGDDWEHPVAAAHGIKFDGMHLARAHRAGVTRVVTPPISTGFFHGLSARFRAGATSVLDDGAVSESEVALHFTIGHAGKTTRTPSISSQIGALYDLLLNKDTSTSPHPVFAAAANGDLPVVLHTQNKDVIAHAIALKRAASTRGRSLRIVIMGGAEAHLLAPELARADIPVLVAPFWGCEPLFWDARNCLPGPPLVDALGPQVLLEAGVTVGVASWDDANNHLRNSLWEASWVAGQKNASAALDLVSRNVERALGLPPTGDVVVYEGSPFEFGARLVLTLEEGRVQTCYPDPDEE